MDPRRELVALQIAATQQANAITAAAAATAAAQLTQSDEEKSIHGSNGDVDLNNKCGEEKDQDITTMSVQPPVSVPLPIAATMITSQGVFTATHNPRSAHRINLLNPHIAPLSTSTSTSTPEQLSGTSTDAQTMIDGRDTYSLCVSSAVSTEGARVVSNVNIMESWRSKVQSHAVRLMNQRGKASNNNKFTALLRLFFDFLMCFFYIKCSK